FFQAEDGIRDRNVTGVQSCALPICGPSVVTGTVTRIDQPASVIVLQDGRMVRVPGGTVLINGQPMAISTIQPGTLVAIQNGQAVTYQNGVYVPADPRRVPYEVSGRVTLIDSVEHEHVLEIGRAH